MNDYRSSASYPQAKQRYEWFLCVVESRQLRPVVSWISRLRGISRADVYHFVARCEH